MSAPVNVDGTIDPEWLHLIEQLRRQRHRLAEEFSEQFHEKSSYAPGLVDERDIRETAERTMFRYCALLAGEELTEQARQHPRLVGARRARQGVPLDELQRATRLSFLVLWSALERIAGAAGASLLVANMDRILNAVESYLSAVQHAYLVEHARLSSDRTLLRNRLVSRFFQAVDDQEDVIRESAEQLSLADDIDYEMLAVAGEFVAAAEQRYGEQRDVYRYEVGGALILFRRQRPDRDWAREMAGSSGGHLGDIKGLRGLRRAARSVLELLQRGTAARLATLRNSWAILAADALDRSLPQFREAVLAPLESCSAAERERLLVTVQRYAETGSIKGTAEFLFCHRNTVVHRLQTFTALTGLDLGVPEQAAWAVVALSEETADL